MRSLLGGFSFHKHGHNVTGNLPVPHEVLSEAMILVSIKLYALSSRAGNSIINILFEPCTGTVKFMNNNLHYNQNKYLRE